MTRAQDIFARLAGHFRRITVPGGTNVGARGINEREDIVGQFDGVSNGLTHGFLLSNGRYIRIDFPRAASTVVSDINDPKSSSATISTRTATTTVLSRFGILMRTSSRYTGPAAICKGSLPGGLGATKSEFALPSACRDWA